MRFIVHYFKKGSQEKHLLFDDPGRQLENPKKFEQIRRDVPSGDHICFVFDDNNPSGNCKAPELPAS